MANQSNSNRRTFLKAVALTTTTATATPAQATATPGIPLSDMPYPRKFSGAGLAMISFPLGGIGAGSLGLGGRGQLRDWEIFNRPDKGKSPSYAFPAIWIKTADQKPIAHVLESRVQTPYEGEDGLGSRNAPGLSRLESATFTSEFPRAHIEFHDKRLPVEVSLTAGTPFVPLDADESGLPATILRYRVRNTSRQNASVAIAFSIENPVKDPPKRNETDKEQDNRTNEIRRTSGLAGVFMHNPAVAIDDLLYGSFALGIVNPPNGKISSLRGWPAGRWWNSPLLFWDDFSADGELGPETEHPSTVGSICLKQEVPPGEHADYTFVLAWQFPNRTPERCGWDAPKDHKQTIIGNWYAGRFKDAWAAAEYITANYAQLEQRTDRFLEAIRQTTVPGAIKDAAMSNLSTLVTPTCFRTADGEFHGFEGIDEQHGCCFGNCTHVWNYETATMALFPSLSRSLRRSAFGYSMDERGALSFRQLLPDKIERWGFVAADGQMGQIIKVYLDWQQSGDAAFLAEFWPKVKLALEFAWVPGGWDADKDGVFEGVQHNTYDVEFYGPNPLCGIYYLAALRAAEEMARASGDAKSAAEYQRLFQNGSRWIDSNLFNGEYYVQKVQGYADSDIAKGLRLGAGADDPRHPQYQVGNGCLIDQLLGQYLADVAGLGALLKRENILKTLKSIYRYNHKADLYDHDNVQRTFALNDEAALVICDYGKGERPQIPFPYYAEVMTGFEYSAASLMLYSGMKREGLECITDIRERYDGIRRNPFDEAECGHHYARAMAAWSGLLALSGFSYRGSESHVTMVPRSSLNEFKSFWSTGSGWGVFALNSSAQKSGFTLSVHEGTLKVKSIELSARSFSAGPVTWADSKLEHSVRRFDNHVVLTFSSEVEVDASHPLSAGAR